MTRKLLSLHFDYRPATAPNGYHEVRSTVTLRLQLPKLWVLGPYTLKLHRLVAYYLGNWEPWGDK